MKNSVWVASGCAFYLLLTCLPVTAQAPNACIECHKSDTFYARAPKLYRYYQDWILSPHHLSGVTCDDCHGGDAAATTAQKAHQGITPASDANSPLYFQNQPETCGECHSDNENEFKMSKHYQALAGETGLAPTCTTCHPAMNKRPSYQRIILNACNSCHAAGNRQNLPQVVEQAQDLLRHLNIAHGLLGWATLHYESRQWPGDSHQRVDRLKQLYRDIVSRVHRFDLARSDESTVTLLDELRALFDAARGVPAEEGHASARPPTDE